MNRERQYKAKILQMKLKRNVDAKERAALVRHIQYRKDILGKVTKYVRVHGHRKTQAKVQQWTKGYPMMKGPAIHIPPSRKSMSGRVVDIDLRLQHSQVRSAFGPGLVPYRPFLQHSVYSMETSPTRSRRPRSPCL